MSKYDDNHHTVDYHEMIECMIGTLDAKDPYTAHHSNRVGKLALTICKLIGVEQNETEKIHIAANLHDIGKIGIPDVVLNKKKKLDEIEWKVIKQHPQIGARILGNSVHLADMKELVLYHHERYDGRGYPYGIKGEEIPIGARIITICDSIDAMISNRTYRSAYTANYCYQEIQKNLGIMYDPEIGANILEHWNQIIISE